MCGLPYHAAHGYIARLLKAGRKVAICDQVEEARPGRLVKREVTQILSPGTHFDERMLAAERNNFLAAACTAGQLHGLALVDLTTGSFRVAEFDSEAALVGEIERVRPAELIYPGRGPAAFGARSPAGRRDRTVRTGHEDWAFGLETAEFTLREHFEVASLDGFGLRDRTRRDRRRRRRCCITSRSICAGSWPTSPGSTFYQTARISCILDAASLRNLEVLEPLHRDTPGARSLFGALHRTVTPMGARRLRDWLSQPLAAPRRSSAARTPWALLVGPGGARRLPRPPDEVRDLERTLGRLSLGSGNARDLVALRLALEQVPHLRPVARTRRATRVGTAPAARGMDSGAAPLLAGHRGAALSPEPALVGLDPARHRRRTAGARLKEGGVIRDGFHAGAGRTARAPRGRAGLDRAAAAGGNRAHRHSVAQDPVQLRVRVLPRGDQVPTWTRCRRTTCASRPWPAGSGSSRRS